ncbi:hypothetical protein SAMN05444339_109104 [Loktanella atrilutea]|uniref:Uncharacterized protein n=1 Tax=Loktanella atrilutea TaxID=366533 RepID=A0A1M5DAR1_LOKAT|nr:hypothetical protein SAMN05444339_109104 [Loktanella atrilutea]
MLNSTGAARSPPKAPGTGVPSGRPRQTAATCVLWKPTTSTSRLPPTSARCAKSSTNARALASSRPFDPFIISTCHVLRLVFDAKGRYTTYPPSPAPSGIWRSASSPSGRYWIAVTGKPSTALTRSPAALPRPKSQAGSSHRRSCPLPRHSGAAPPDLGRARGIETPTRRPAGVRTDHPARRDQMAVRHLHQLKIALIKVYRRHRQPLVTALRQDVDAPRKPHCRAAVADVAADRIVTRQDLAVGSRKVAPQGDGDLLSMG